MSPSAENYFTSESHYRVGAGPLRPLGSGGDVAEVHANVQEERAVLVVKFLEIYTQREVRPRWGVYARHGKDLGIRRFCLWGEDGAMSVFRDRLHSLLRAPEVRRGVVKCKRVQQRDD